MELKCHYIRSETSDSLTVQIFKLSITLDIEVSNMFDFANVKFDITSDSNDNKPLNNFVSTLNNSNQINEYTLQPEKITNSILGYSVQIATVIMNVTFFYSIEALISIANKSFELVITKQQKKCYITQLLIL